jgi:hypothetical protein
MMAKNPVGISFFVCISQNNIEVRKEKKGRKKKLINHENLILIWLLTNE